MNKLDMIRLQKALAEAAMPSGFEGHQAKIISSFAKSIGFTVQQDVLGNLYCHKDGETSGQMQAGTEQPAASGRKLMLAAAMDVKGFLVTHVSDEKVRFNVIGTAEAEKLVDAPVRFENGRGGVIRSADTAGEKDEKKKKRKLEDLYIEVNASEDAEKQSAPEKTVQTGDAAVLTALVTEREGGLIQTPHGDHLTGCLALLDAMERLRDDPAAADVTFVFLVQHWSGRMGMRSAVKRVSPHTCILCGAAEAASEMDEAEEPSEPAVAGEIHPIDVEIGAGPVIRFRENLQANDAETCRLLVKAAELAGIPWQGEARNRDKSGAMEAMSAGSRPGVSWLGVPVQNMGTAETVYRADEVNRCGQVLAALCRLE